MLIFEARRGPLFLLLALLLLPPLVGVGYLAYGERIAAIVSKANETGLSGQLATLGLMICATLLALLAVATFWLRSVLAVTLRPTGLSGRGALGKPAFMHYEAMQAARRVRLPFAPLLRIDGDGGPLYLPLFLARAGLFVEAVDKLASDGLVGEGHPLLAAREALRGA